MADGDGSSRNFRSAYYEKLVICGSEEKNILDLLMTSSQFDFDKPNELCDRFDLDKRCIDAWKVLLGIECARKNPFDEFANVRRVRAEHFQSLKHHLEALLKHSVVIKHRLEKSSKQETNNEPSQENCSSALEDENSSSPSAKDIAKQITLMYLLEAGQLESSDIDAQLNTNYCRKLSALASFFVKVSSDVQEAFFLFRNFNRKLDQNEALAMSRDDANKSNK